MKAAPILRTVAVGLSCSSAFSTKSWRPNLTKARVVNQANDSVAKEPFNPSWKDILEVPISVEHKEEFDSLPTAKRIAIISRASVLHLTLLSCFGPFILRGCIRSATGLASMPLNLPLACLWTINVLSWHAFHNLVNDWQDLEDDDKESGSFRTDYGCHALKQGFLTKPQFLRLMALVALPGTLLTLLFRNTVVGPAGPWGLAALFLYTILFKPLALGEVSIYLVWGPLMAGYGAIAAGAPFTGVAGLFSNPATAQFGLAALGLIMGKHTDKINRSEKQTLPKLLGYPSALFACGAAVIAPHVLLLGTFLKERVLGYAMPTVPLGASLAFLTLFRELPCCLRVLRKGQLKDGEPKFPPGTSMKGWAVDFQQDRTWPLWFVAVCGWHAITFLYFFVIGSGLEWGGRALLSRSLL